MSDEFLKNITFSVKPNELVGIVGSVGSGKTSLLMALMNELHNMKGDVEIKGRVFYVAQEPWIYSATIKENILFGNDYDRTKFNSIIDICALNEVLSVKTINRNSENNVLSMSMNYENSYILNTYSVYSQIVSTKLISILDILKCTLLSRILKYSKITEYHSQLNTQFP
jgi:ATPase subunit of ABC transporter with duplicated ATPase domains